MPDTQWALFKEYLIACNTSGCELTETTSIIKVVYSHNAIVCLTHANYERSH